MWIVTLIIVLIFGFIMQPIQKWVYAKISRKWLAYIVTTLIGAVILLGMHWIAEMMGYKRN